MDGAAFTSFTRRSFTGRGELPHPARAATLKRLEWITWFTDNAIRIPGTRRTVGADALLSLLPGVGSFAGAGISFYLVAEAWRHGVPVPKLLRMGGNIAIDTLGGSVPIAGVVFDALFKSNQRNMDILHGHLRDVGPTKA